MARHLLLTVGGSVCFLLQNHGKRLSVIAADSQWMSVDYSCMTVGKRLSVIVAD